MIRKHRVLALCLTAILAAAACAGATPTVAPNATGAAPTAAAGSTAPGSSASPAASSATVDSTPFGFGYASSASMSYVPELVAFDTMKANGYSVTQTQFASDSLTAAALATNAIQLDAGDTVGFSNIIASTPIKLVDARQNNEWSLVATVDITDCKQLTGKKVGYFNLTGVSTAYPKAYFQENCPDVNPDVVLIPDSGLRAKAMAAGQLTATPLQLNDAIALLAQNPGKFHTLVNFATSLNGIGRDFIATNGTTLTSHQPQLEAFIAAHLIAIRSFYETPGTALAAANKYLPPDPGMADIVKAYVDGKLWCANGGLQDGALGKALTYLQGFGLVKGPTTEAAYLAPGPLLNVLTTIGTSKDTDC